MAYMNGADIQAIDNELIATGISLAARPFHVVVRIIQANGGGDLMAPAIWEQVMTAYHRLYPSGNFGAGALLVGGVGMRDQFYLAHVNFGYGKQLIEPLKSIVIPEAELAVIWQARA